MPAGNLLQREIRELKAVYTRGKMKVDHPETTKADNITFGRGSKDTADAVCGAHHAMNLDLELFTKLSKHYIRKSYGKHMKKQVVSNKQTIKKDMMKITRSGGYERFRNKELTRNKALANERTARIRENVRVSKRDISEGNI